MHKNNMTVWPEIACQRDHGAHLSLPITVDLGQRHGYRDLPQIPERLARAFTMNVWRPDVYPVDGGPYCPAHDAVSETILTHGIWEPRETIAALQVMSGSAPGAVVDLGAQIGWFTILAGSCGRDVVAFEADPENRRLLKATVQANDFGQQVRPSVVRLTDFRVDAQSPALPAAPIRFAKIDLEGAERDAVRMLWPSIEQGWVDHMMIEISPVFDDYYPDLVADLVSAGFDAYLLPPKQSPPARLDRFPNDLVPFFIDEPGVFDLGPLTKLRETVASWHQEDVWFARRGAAW